MRYLKRSNQFLTGRALEEVGARAELCFRALGYERQLGDSEICFTRGRKLGSILRTNLREALATVRVELTDGLITVQHEIEVLGRPFWRRDRDIVDAEARLLKDFLDQDQRGLDLDELERACTASQQAHAAVIAGVGTLVLIVAIGLGVSLVGG